MESKMGTDEQTRSVHSRCFACGSSSPGGLHLEFRDSHDGRVTASCTVGNQYQGYSGMVQGGIIATILDSAMTNCLFCRDIEAVTARLNVSYREPVLIGHEMIVEAALIRRRGRVYELEASLLQAGHVKASASGRFMVPRDAL